jgi:hypothetical protein
VSEEPQFPSIPDDVGDWLHSHFGGVSRFIPSATVKEAIGRLILGAADVPVALLHSLTHRIQDGDAARSAVTQMNTAAARKEAEQDPQFGRRALANLTRHLARGQSNREAIAKQAVALLAAEPPPTGQTMAPSEDFMNLFADHAERASSEALQDMFARVLAGEIRKPGEFSLRALQFVAVMDQEIAGAVKFAKRFMIERGVAQPSVVGGELWRCIGILQDTGLVRSEGLHRDHAVTGNGALITRRGKVALVAKITDGERLVRIGFFHLSPVGEQIMTIVPEGNAEADLSELAKEIAAPQRNSFLGTSLPDSFLIGEIVSESAESGTVQIAEGNVVWERAR